MGNKHKRGIKIVILTCFLIIVFFLLAYYFFQFIKRMKWDIVSFDVISLKIIIRCIFLYIISLKYYYINFILGQFRISKKIHLKISFLSHNKEKKRSHSIFFFSSYFRIPTTSLPSQDRNKRSYHSQQSEKKRRVYSWNVYEFKWTRSFRVPVDRFKLSDRFRGKPRYRVTNTRNPLTRKYISGCDSSRASSNLNKLDPSVYLC